MLNCVRIRFRELENDLLELCLLVHLDLQSFYFGAGHDASVTPNYNHVVYQLRLQSESHVDSKKFVKYRTTFFPRQAIRVRTNPLGGVSSDPR